MAGMILAGTRKGLLCPSRRRRPPLLVRRGAGPRRVGDLPRGAGSARRLHATAAGNNPVYGATVHRSTDNGQTWTRSEDLGLPEDGELKLEKTWHVEPGGTPSRAASGSALHPASSSARTIRVRAGRSTRGCSHTNARALEPRRRRDVHALDSARPRGREPDVHRHLGGRRVPARGRRRVVGRRRTREPAADFSPDDPFPEVGQCVHKLLLHAGRRGASGSRTTAASTGRTDDGGRLGAARGERTAERLRLPAGSRPPAPRYGLRHTPRTVPRLRGRPREPRHHRRRLGSTGRRTAAGAGSSFQRAAQHAWVEVLREVMSFGQGRFPRVCTSARKRLGVGLARTRGTSGSRPRASSRRSCRSKSASDDDGSLVPGACSRRRRGGGRSSSSRRTRLGDALRALPVADLLFDEAGQLAPACQRLVDRQDVRERDLDTPLGAERRSGRRRDRRRMRVDLADGVGLQASRSSARGGPSSSGPRRPRGRPRHLPSLPGPAGRGLPPPLPG